MTSLGKIAFLGLGAMGQRMASRLAAGGHDVVVWSRSGVPSSAPLLAERGAKSIRAAVEAADFVLSMVTDDDASRAVWLTPDGGALNAMRAEAVVVECSTLSPGWVSTLALRARAAGFAFVEAPVVGSRPQAEAGGLVFLAGGDLPAVDRVRPILASIGSAVHHVGATPAGAYAKLIVNTLFGVQVAALAELLGFAGKAQLDLSALMQALDGLPVLSPSAKGAATGMLARRFDPMFPVELISKDFRYALAAAKEVDSSLPVARRAGEVFETGSGSGLADENLTAIAKLYA
jgi:3-hydroxyisobutyrate dehydrogenase